jgi:hypothetical protein
MKKNTKYILIAVAIAAVIVVAAMAFLSMSQEPVYDSKGKVKAKSSNLKFTYKNEESIYGSFKKDGSFDHVMYYDEAKLKGKVKIDLNKVKWDESYVPDNDTDADGNVIVHANDLNYAKNNFTDQLMADYNNGTVNITVDVYLQKSDGSSVHTHESYDEGDNIDLPGIVKNFKIENGVVTMKIKNNYHVDIKTPISNGADYHGSLLSHRNSDHKVSKAKIVMTFKSDKYDMEVKSVLKGKDFTHVHM